MFVPRTSRPLFSVSPATHGAFILLTILLICTFAFADAKTRLEDVASKLSCFCNSCPHLSISDCTCSLADRIRKDISSRIARGETEDQIIKSYVAQYGQTVLSAPPKSGFNLTPWLVPVVAFGIGGTILITFLKKQRKSILETQDKSETSPDPEDSHYRELLEKELQQRK
jgi:cytochrome c-type biogenesis protein CcmH